MNSKKSTDCLFWLYQDNYRTYNIDVARCLGVNAAIILSQLASKQRYFREKGKLTEQGYFYYTMEDLHDDTAISKHEQNLAIEILTTNGLIFKIVLGIPPKRHFRCYERAIMEFFFRSDQLSDKSKMEKKQAVDSVSANSPETGELILRFPANPIYNPNLHDPKEEKIIIATSQQERTPAAGNNNFSASTEKKEKSIYPCLEACQDLSITQKRDLTTKYKDQEEYVKKCMEYIYHEDGPEILGGPIGKLKYLKHMLNNPESYKNTLDELGHPKMTKAQQIAREVARKADEFEELRTRNKSLVDKFESGEIYNGWKCKISQDWFEFGKKADRKNLSINFGDADFSKNLKHVLKTIGIS